MQNKYFEVQGEEATLKYLNRNKISLDPYYKIDRDVSSCTP